MSTKDREEQRSTVLGRERSSRLVPTWERRVRRGYLAGARNHPHGRDHARAARAAFHGRRHQPARPVDSDHRPAHALRNAAHRRTRRTRASSSRRSAASASASSSTAFREVLNIPDRKRRRSPRNDRRRRHRVHLRASARWTTASSSCSTSRWSCPSDEKQQLETIESVAATA